LSKYLFDEKFSREFFIITVVSSHQSAFLTHSKGLCDLIIALLCCFHRAFFLFSSHFSLKKPLPHSLD